MKIVRKMKYSDEVMKSFYQQMGKLFYAIAAADKTVRKEELEALKKLVRSEWLKLDETYDEFGSDSAYQIEIVFDWLTENEWDMEDTISGLKDFREVHPSLFTDRVNTLIIKTASAIADSFQGKNKSELTILTQLGSILSS
ncbi:MAG: hypothetical protein WC380_08775 [Pedobacter sp.]|jgi:hypothetical protein